MDNEHDLETDCCPSGPQRGVDSLKSRADRKCGSTADRFDSGIDSLYSTESFNSGGLKSEIHEGRCISGRTEVSGIDGIEQRVGSLSLKQTDSTKCTSIDEGFESSNLKSEDLFSVDEKRPETICEETEKSEPCEQPNPAFVQAFQQDDDGDTQLHTSIIQLVENLAIYFISLVPDSSFLNIRNNYLQSPLHLAVITKQPLLTRKLITAGAHVDVRDHKGNSPLHIAAKEGYGMIARILLEPVHFDETRDNAYEIPYQRIPQNLEGRNYDGQVTLHLAAEGAHLEVLSVLIERGANINARDGKSGRTVLHYAADSGHMPLLQFLLSQPNIDINHITYGGLTPVMLAKGRGHEDAVRLLREHGAFYDSDDSSEEEEMNEDSYDDFKINGQPIADN